MSRRRRDRPADAQPLLLAALPAAVRDRRRRGAAHLGAARSGAEQPGRRRREVEGRHRSVHAARDDEGSVRDVAVPDPVRGVHLLHAGRARPRRQLTSRPTRCRRRRKSCRNGICCRSTRSCARSISTSARSIPSSRACIAMFGSIAVLFVLPWLDTSRVRSMRYRPIARQFFLIFVVVCVVLGWCGGQNPGPHPAQAGDVRATLTWVEGGQRHRAADRRPAAPSEFDEAAAAARARADASTARRMTYVDAPRRDDSATSSASSAAPQRTRRSSTDRHRRTRAEHPRSEGQRSARPRPSSRSSARHPARVHGHAISRRC